MTDNFWNDADIIDVYTDEQAVEDGVLIPVSFGIINRVTKAVFDECKVNDEIDLAMFNIFMEKAIEEFDLQRQMKDDWFYKINVEGRNYFVVRNEKYFTLMKPEDY